MFRPVGVTSQKICNFDARWPSAGGNIRFMYDEAMTAGRISGKVPTVTVWTAVELRPVTHLSYCFLVL
jgi:hypothetical protein